MPNAKRSNHPILLIVFWSLLVHVPGIFSPLRDYQAYRQTQTASMSRNYVRHGMRFLSPEVDTEGPPVRAATEFPIYSYLLALAFKYGGVQEIFGRLLSCLFAAWGAVYLYLFVRPRFGSRIAVWSGLVMCSIPVHVYFTRTVQPEPMALWGFLGFLYHCDRWLHHYGSGMSWLGALLLGAIAPLLKLPFLYLIVPLWFYLGYERFQWNVFKNIRWVSLLVLILGLTEAWYFYAKSAAVQIVPLGAKEHLENLAILANGKFYVDQFISRIPEIVTTYSGLVLAFIGAYYFRKAKSYNLLVFWTVASAAYVVLLGDYGHIHRYTLLPLAPIAAFWIALGISAAWAYAKNHPMSRVFIVLLIIGVPVHAALRVAHWYKIEYNYLPRAHDVLKSVSSPTDLVLVVTHEKPTYLYYLDHYGYSIDPVHWTKESADALMAHQVRFVFLPMEDNHVRLADWKTYLAARHAVLVKADPDYLLYKVPSFS